ncbi:MAG: DUF2505 domain-containing protein [Myxococcales bacterium]|nr:DUF2505 domain-containing protein [Myxococcales bacterium]
MPRADAWAKLRAARLPKDSMHFRAAHTFALPLADYEKLHYDEDFNAALCKATGLQRTLVERTLDGGRLRRAVKVSPERQVPAPVAKLLGGARIEYTEHVDYTFGSGRGTWRTVSSLLTDKVKSAGTIQFTERGGQTERVVEGDVDVKIMLVGGTVERFVVDDVLASYERAAEFTRNWIRTGGKA